MVPNPPGTTTDETLAEPVQRELQEGLIRSSWRISGQYNTSLQFVGNGHIRFRCGSSTAMMMLCTVDGRSVCHSCEDRMSERDWAATLLTDVRKHIVDKGVKCKLSTILSTDNSDRYQPS
jgi:hypothetical protein